MALRWYTTVIEITDPRGLAGWWAEAAHWTKVYEADEEVVIVPTHMADEQYQQTPWEQAASGLVFVRVPEGKVRQVGVDSQLSTISRGCT